MIITLTESLLERLTATDGRILRDRLLCGFAVRANKRHRTFLIVTSVKGRQVRMMLGYWPLMSVEEARSQAMEVLRECRAGRIPSRAKPKPLPTLREALAAYGEAKGLKASSRKRYDSLFRTHFGDWLDRMVDELASAAFSEHCAAFASSRGNALVEVGRGVVTALIHLFHQEGIRPSCFCSFDPVVDGRERDPELFRDNQRRFSGLYRLNYSFSL